MHQLLWSLSSEECQGKEGAFSFPVASGFSLSLSNHFPWRLSMSVLRSPRSFQTKGGTSDREGNVGLRGTIPNLPSDHERECICCPKVSFLRNNTCKGTAIILEEMQRDFLRRQPSSFPSLKKSSVSKYSPFKAFFLTVLTETYSRGFTVRFITCFPVSGIPLECF